MNMNIDNDTVGVARSKIFMSIVMKESKISRGVITDRLHVSSHTFTSEYKDYLEKYPSIKYDEKTRIFSYEP